METIEYVVITALAAVTFLQQRQIRQICLTSGTNKTAGGADSEDEAAAQSLENSVLEKNAATQQHPAPVVQTQGEAPEASPVLLGSRGRVCVFVDGPNMLQASYQLGCNIYYGTVLETLHKRSEYVQSAHFYAHVNVDTERASKHEDFLKSLSSYGYRINEALLGGSEGGSMQHSDVPCLLITEMLTLSPTYDTAILLSSNSDFYHALKSLKDQGKHVEVWSFLPRTSPEMRDLPDNFVDLMAIEGVWTPRRTR